MKLITLVAAHNVVLDQRTNQASIFQMIERINSVMFPSAYGPVVVMALLSREAKDQEVERAELSFDLDGVSIWKTALDVDFKGQKAARAILDFQGIALTKPGKLAIKFSTAGQVLGEYPIEIALVESLPSMTGVKRLEPDMQLDAKKSQESTASTGTSESAAAKGEVAKAKAAPASGTTPKPRTRKAGK